MNKLHLLPLTAIALAVLAGCNTTPANNARLEEARSEYRMAQDSAPTRDLAGGELKQAGDALNKANAAWVAGNKPAEVDHLAYLAKQRVAIAQEIATQKTAEMSVTNAEAARDKARLASRTAEVATAQRGTELAQSQTEEAKRQAASSQQQATNAQQQASSSQARTAQLEAQLKDMNAKQTERGMVITIGDVLFDTDKAQLKAGGMRNMDKLVGFMKENPQRKVRIEGFTDSVGSDAHNQELSARRADAVRTALVDMGVTIDRIATQGYGEAHPVAGNDSASGRQLNRRVEIVLSDDAGKLVSR